MTFISHSKAFAAQEPFALESKLKVGADVWTSGTHGSRLYAEVLSKNPSTVGNAIKKAASLSPPFTEKQVQGHIRWLFTAGELEVDGKSYTVQSKPKAAKVPAKVKVKVEAKVEAKPEAKIEPKGEKPKARAVAARKRAPVKTKKAA